MRTTSICAVALSLATALPAAALPALPPLPTLPAASDVAAPGGGEGPALARSVAIFVVSGEQVGTPISELYAAARRGIEADTALEVAPFEVFPPSMREESIRRCAGDGGCFARAVRDAGVDVDLLLLVSADRLGEGILLGLRLVDLHKKAGEDANIAAVGEQLPEGVSLLRAMKDYLEPVFPKALWGQVASLKIEVDQANAEVLVGQKTCVSPCRFDRLLPGDYDVLVRKKGYQDYKKSVSLQSRHDETLTVSLTEESGSIFASPFFWGATGAVVAAAAVTTVLIVTSNSGPFVICIAKDQALCK
ncbi:MAG: PEGA domain-containing protein [Myxococcota bacterium]